MLPEFNQTDTDGRKYHEITLPGGTFRMFEDRPYVWNQILQPGEKSLIEKIEDAYASGQISKK